MQVDFEQKVTFKMTMDLEALALIETALVFHRSHGQLPSGHPIYDLSRKFTSLLSKVAGKSVEQVVAAIAPKAPTEEEVKAISPPGAQDLLQIVKIPAEVVQQTPEKVTATNLGMAMDPPKDDPLGEKLFQDGEEV